MLKLVLCFKQRRHMPLILIVSIYLIIINIVTFITFGLDKRKAQKHKWRISEQALITLMLAGGAVGGYLGMEKFRHKTQKLKFKIARWLSFVSLIGIIGFTIYMEF